MYHQQGQSYIEVSVALLLISLSLTGLVTSMLSAQHLSRHAIERFDVALLMNNISNQLYLNSAESSRKQSEYLMQIDQATIISVNCTATKECAQRLQALQDLQHWQQRLNRKLVAYNLVLCRDGSMRDGMYADTDGCDNKHSSPLVIKLWWKGAGTDELYFYALEYGV